MSGARIIKRTETRISPWVRVVAKEVLTAPSLTSETYHCLALADYVAIVARLPDGRLPIVRQFRPAVDCQPWELPAGLVERDEPADHAAKRELLEETGATALTVVDLGTFLPDTGRLENRIRVFGVEAAPPAPDFVPEPGMSVALASPSQLRAMIHAGEFDHMLHVGALAAAELKGFRTGVFS